MDFALLIEPNLGLTYGQQLELAQRAESAGLSTLYRSDHYQSAPGPEEGSADRWKAERGDFWLVGTPADAEQAVVEFAAAGAERVVFQDFIANDLPMIDLLGGLAGAWAGMASATPDKTTTVQEPPPRSA